MAAIATVLHLQDDTIFKAADLKRFAVHTDFGCKSFDTKAATAIINHFRHKGKPVQPTVHKGLFDLFGTPHSDPVANFQVAGVGSFLVKILGHGIQNGCCIKVGKIMLTIEVRTNELRR